MTSDTQQEFSRKRQRIASFLQDHGLDAVLLGTRANFAWATGGRDNHVVQGTEDGFAQLLISRDRAYVLATNIEMPRLEDEELRGLDVEAIPTPWHAEDVLETVRNLGIDHERVRSDMPALGMISLDNDFDRLRYQLTPFERSRYRQLGQEARDIVEEICGEIQPGWTEHDVAGEVEGALVAGGLIPSVMLVGSDERAYRYRHPIPKDKPIDRYVMVVVCARRHGLVANLTRCVHFGEPPSELRERFEAVTNVDAQMIASTRIGTPISQIFDRCVDAYREVGFDGEWKHHHQGGATGYVEREYVATPDIDETVLDGQAFAWNPSIQGSKSEDTVLVTEADGVESITQPGPDWPTVVHTVDQSEIARPGLLVR